jgi:hypothetical protein
LISDRRRLISDRRGRIGLISDRRRLKSERRRSNDRIWIHRRSHYGGNEYFNGRFMMMVMMVVSMAFSYIDINMSTPKA